MTQQKDSRPAQVQTGGGAVGALAGGSQAHDNTRAQELQGLAKRYHELGINLLPTDQDKRPPELAPEKRLLWDKWQVERQTTNDLARLPWHLADGLAGISGPVSDNLACMDFDKGDTARLVQVALAALGLPTGCLLYTSPSPRDGLLSRMPSSA